MTAADALYVYGVVPGDTTPDLFAGVDGMADGPVRLVGADGVAAIASSVPLTEFDTDALEQNLKDGEWLEQKGRGPNRVLGGPAGEGPAVPLRLRAPYTREEHGPHMFRER